MRIIDGRPRGRLSKAQKAQRAMSRFGELMGVESAPPITRRKHKIATGPKPARKSTTPHNPFKIPQEALVRGQQASVLARRANVLKEPLPEFFKNPDARVRLIRAELTRPAGDGQYHTKLVSALIGVMSDEELLGIVADYRASLEASGG